MSDMKAGKAKKSKKAVETAMSDKIATIDLTSEKNKDAGKNKKEDLESADCLAVAGPSTIPKPRINNEGGMPLKKKKSKSGADQFLNCLKTRPTSGKVIEKQTEFTTKLAEFEEVLDELQVERTEIGASYVCRIPKPADWVRNPRRQPSYDQSAIDELAMSSNEEYSKIIKLADCMKYMNIEVNPRLMKYWYMEPLRREAAAQAVKVVEEPALCFRAVALSRTMPRELSKQDGMVQLTSTRKNSMRFLYILAASDMVELLKDREIIAHMAARKQILGGKITLLVVDSEDYFMKGKPEADLEMAIVDMLVTLEIDTLLMKDSVELISTILQYTKAVAEEPAKLAKRAIDEEANFYMRGDNKNCVSVDKEGNGIPNLYQQMLSVIPQSSLEIARAISAKYTCPRSLAEVLMEPEGVLEVAALPVPRSGAPGAKPRRVGVEMANRLKILFTEEDGSVLLK